MTTEPTTGGEARPEAVMEMETRVAIRGELAPKQQGVCLRKVRVNVLVGKGLNDSRSIQICGLKELGTVVGPSFTVSEAEQFCKVVQAAIDVARQAKPIHTQSLAVEGAQ